MTLGEKFWNVNQESFTDRMIANEKIADEFAIKFKDWCDNEGRFTIGVNTTKELLQIYKKEKGL